MTLSSPERSADVRVWEPADIAGGPALPAAGATPSAPSAAGLFEVSPTAGIPDAVLNPARLAAQSAGYVAGWNRGREAGQLAVEAEAALIRAAEQEQARAVRAQIAQAIDALHDAARAFEHRTGPSPEAVEDLILTTAFQLAEAIVGVNLADDRLRGRAALHRALAAAPSDVAVTVRLNPQDLASLEAAGLDVDAAVTVVADPSLAPGDAVAATASTRIDARIATALERARRVLHGAVA
jgi:flagellar assembly protein FliH